MSLYMLIAIITGLLALPAVFALLYTVTTRGALPSFGAVGAGFGAAVSKDMPEPKGLPGQMAMPGPAPATEALLSSPAADSSQLPETTDITTSPPVEADTSAGAIALAWEPDAERFNFHTAAGKAPAMPAAADTTVAPKPSPKPSWTPQTVSNTEPEPEVTELAFAAETAPPKPAVVEAPILAVKPAVPEIKQPRRAKPPGETPAKITRRPKSAESGPTRAKNIPPSLPPMAFSLLSPSGLQLTPVENPHLARMEEALLKTFTPTHPKQKAQDLVGCEEEVGRAITAIEAQSHLIIFGERGRGKTSLANVVTDLARNAGYLVVGYSCNSSTTFNDMFASVLRNIPARFFQSQHRRDAGLPETGKPNLNDFGSAEIAEILGQTSRGRVLVHIDEFDRLGDSTVKRQIAELVKALSDSTGSVTFLIVGVADDLEELLGHHPSIQRNITPLHMRVRSDEEIERILDSGAQAAGLEFSGEVRQTIIQCSAGSPYLAQLLAHHAGRFALRNKRSEVMENDFEAARAHVLGDLSYAVGDSLRQATAGREILSQMVYATASCKSDTSGAFLARDAAAQLARLIHRNIDLQAVQRTLARFTTPEGGKLLRSSGTGDETSYRFSHSLMRQYVLLEGWRTADPAGGAANSTPSNSQPAKPDDKHDQTIDPLEKQHAGRG